METREEKRSVKRKLMEDAKSIRGVEMTLEEIGCQLGLTRERVRQIEASGLAKLRKLFSELDFIEEPRYMDQLKEVNEVVDASWYLSPEEEDWLAAASSLFPARRIARYMAGSSLPSHLIRNYNVRAG